MSTPFITKVDFEIEIDKNNKKIDEKVKSIDSIVVDTIQPSLEKIDEKVEEAEKIKNLMGNGYKGVIKPTTPPTELTTLPDGIYLSYGAGTYLFNPALQIVEGSAVNVIPDGYSVKFSKINGTWSVASVEKLPMQDLSNITNDLSQKVNKTSFNPLVNEGTEYLIFSLQTGQINPTTGITNTSVNWLSTNAVNVESDKEYSIEGFGNGTAGSVVFPNNRVAFFNGNTLIGWVGGFQISKLTFTTPSNCDNIKINVEAGTNVGNSPSTSSYNNSLKIYEGSEVVDYSLKGSMINGRINTEQLLRLERETEKLETILPIFNVGREIEVNISAGGVNKSTGTDSSSNNWIRSSYIDCIEGDEFFIKGTKATIETPNLERFFLYNGDNYVSYLPSTYQDGYLYFKATAGVTRFRFHVDGGTDVGNNVGNYNVEVFKNGELLSIKKEYLNETYINDIYVDVNSTSIIEDGSLKNPYKTLSKAYQNFKDSSNIIIKEGVYREFLNTTLRDVNYKGVGNVIISGSEIISGFVKTNGRTNIYQVNYSKSVATPSEGTKRLFENGRKSQLIPIDEIHPLQRGYTYYLPYSELKEVASIELVDSTQGSYCIISDVLYIHTNDSSNPNTSGYTIENAVRSTTSTTTTNTDLKDIKIDNITFQFSNREGLLFSNGKLSTNNCRYIGNAREGKRSDNAMLISYNDEACGNGSDGMNGHHYNFDVNNIHDQYYCYYFNPYSHHNRGDGLSHHERANLYIYNPLFDYNLRRGVIPYGGCSAVINNGLIRRNKLEGVYSQGILTDGKLKTSTVVLNTSVIGHDVNYCVGDEATLHLSNCKSANARINDISVKALGYLYYEDFEVDVVGSKNISNIDGTVITKAYTKI